MEFVEVKLFGPFRIHRDGQDVTEGATDKARALLTFLALEGEQPRTRLTALLWPYLSQEAAFDNLRKTLYRLRRRLGVDLLIAKRQSVQLDTQGVTVDALRFQSLLKECERHPHTSLAGCDECVARLDDAAELYQGALLGGFELSDAPDFEEWLLLRRQTLQNQALLTLGELTTAWEVRGDLARAAAYNSRALTLDPLREESQRQQMRLLAQMGLPKQALEQYEAFRRLIRQALNLDEESATALLAQQILNQEFEGKEAISSSPSQSRSVALPHSQSATLQILSDIPHSGRVYGRRHEVERLTHWISETHARLITLVGMGGIGKTTLAAAVATAVAGHFEVVLWRSLVNAPPLQEILSDWLVILSENSLAPLPESLDAQLAMLVDHLRARRCLLVLDNLESIFQPDQAGQMRPEHRGYTQLLHRIAETQHQSCLLLTSRELPQGVARMQEDLPWVHSMALDGLDMTAAQALLLDRGLTGEGGATLSLVERYSGNPLALKLVAETAQGLFAGDIAAFLMADTLIFDDIRTVLDWQFDRLPALEQEILLWLAVEREPVSIQTIRDNLFPPRPLSEVLVAIRGLQRRSLLERAGPNDPAQGGHALGIASTLAGKEPQSSPGSATFALQNVLMEYLIDRLVEAAAQEIEQENLQRLRRHALIKAYAKEYVRQSQVRLILQPVANRLLASMSKGEIGSKIARLLAKMRQQAPQSGSNMSGGNGSSGYAAGSLLNLLLLLEIDLTGYDFSHLPVWQADLRRAQLPAVDFTAADLTRTFFVDSFGFVYSIVYSPDGRTFAAATDNGGVRLWQAADGRLLRSFAGHRGTVRSLAFSPNGALLASGGEDGTVRIWHLSEPPMQGGELNPLQHTLPQILPQILRGHSGRVMSVAFHPDGKRLASAGVDQTIRLWDLATGEMTGILRGHEGWVWALAFHPSGETLASTGTDRSIRLWDLMSASTRAILTGHSEQVNTLAYDPEGRRLASGGFDRTVRLWDVESGQTIQILQASLDAIWRIAFSPDGRLLATSGDDTVARIWDLQSGTILYALHGHKDVIFALAFSPDGQMLVTGSADQSIRLWDLPDPRIRQIIAGPNQIVPVVLYHPDGKFVVSAHHNGNVRFWDSDLRMLRQSHLDPERFLSTIRISGDGAWLASGGDDLQLWRIDGEGRTQLHQQSQVHHLQGHRGRIYALAFNPTGALLASGGMDQAVYLWDVEKGELRHTLPGNEMPIYSLAFSPEVDHFGASSGRSASRSLLATGSISNLIALWDIAATTDERLLHQWHGHSGAVWGLAFTPDGETLISCGGDGLILLWDIRDPRQPLLRATLRGHSDRVFAIALSAGGQRLYSSSADRTIIVWDLQSLQPLQTYHGHTHWVWSLSLSPDGKTLASGSADEAIRLWDTASGECRAILVAPGPYQGMKIQDVQGITEAEKATLKLMGAVEE